MAGRIYNLFEMTYVEVQEWLKETDIILVPCGSLEQHGKHLPVSTDSIATWLITTKAAKLANVPHAPLVWMGFSPQHMRPPGNGMGTVTLREETYKNLLLDIGRSLIHHGFNKVVYATGHTSNVKVFDPVLRLIRYETGALACLFRADAEAIPPYVTDITENPPEETPGWHGSEIETSECLAYDPKLVHLERVQPERTHAPKWFPPGFSKHNGSPYVRHDATGSELLYVPMDHWEYSDTGLIGNPFRASAEKGHKITDRMAERFAAYIEALKAIKVEVKDRGFMSRV